MTNDPADMAMIVLNGTRDFFACPGFGAVDHERIAGARDVVGWAHARGWDASFGWRGLDIEGGRCIAIGTR